ncbi:MAG: anti-sigma factor [Betaproteobacteria bacterium]
MNCNEAGTLLAAYADGELDRLRAHAIEAHLRGCAGCEARHREVLALRARLRAEVPYFPATGALRARVDATLGAMRAATPRRARPVNDRWRWLGGGALAGCAATVFAWTLATAVIAWHADQDLAVEAVAMHVRATHDNRQVQVASSDQHTVKPWLSARLDYSPPVQDLASEGFALIGGRLDTLAKEPVATLVYRYRLHTIDVYVRPETAHAPTSERRTIRGFHVVQSNGSGMDWVAVSDVSADVLTAFVHRLAQQAPSQ